MTDFTQSRTFKTAQYPVHAIVTSGLLAVQNRFLHQNYLRPDTFRSSFLSMAARKTFKTRSSKRQNNDGHE